MLKPESQTEGSDVPAETIHLFWGKKKESKKAGHRVKTPQIVKCHYFGCTKDMQAAAG